MPRTIGLVAIILCAAVAAFGDASAQPTGIPACDQDRVQLIDRVLKSGQVPNFLGCDAKFAAQRIRRAFGDNYGVAIQSEPNGTFEPGIVFKQWVNGRQVGLVAAARASQPTALAAAAQPPPPPPPPPIPTMTAYVPPVGGVPGAAAAAAPGVVPPQQRVSFSIADAEPVAEGKPIVFRITRSGDDGQAHDIGLGYPENANLLVDHPPSFRFEPGGAAQRDLSLNTVPGLPGDGSHDVQVALVPTKGTEIGVPRVGTGTITDVPLPEKVANSITADAPAGRGSALHFTVTRTGPLGPARVPYSVVQDGATLTLDMQPQPAVEFTGGSNRASVAVPGGLYQICGSPPAVTLDDGAGTQAAATFSDPPPDNCRPPRPWYQPIIDILDPNDPKFPVLIVVIVLIGGITTYRLVRKPPADTGSSGGGANDGEKLPESLDDVETSLDIKPGTASFQPLEDPASRWPKFSADVTIEPGELFVTQPLPRLEKDNG